jgi:hypothetical protein
VLVMAGYASANPPYALDAAGKKFISSFKVLD